MPKGLTSFLLGFVLVGILITGCTSMNSKDPLANTDIPISSSSMDNPSSHSQDGAIKQPAAKNMDWVQMTARAGWSPRGGQSIVSGPDNSILLMGGVDNNGSHLLNDTWRSIDYGASWTQMTSSAGWAARRGHSSVMMPDGSIILMGGSDNRGTYYNDVWRTTDSGVTWMQMTPSAGWAARTNFGSVTMPDGSIVMMGGWGNDGFKNDTWRSLDNGVTWSLINASAGWSKRSSPNSVVLPDGSTVLIGGSGSRGDMNDTWRSINDGMTWTEMSASAGWSRRSDQTSVAMPDGSIVLIGGYDRKQLIQGNTCQNDTWLSADNGVTWTKMTGNTGWMGRAGHSSVAMPDSSIVLIGGFDNSQTSKNDVWRLTFTGS